MSRRPGEDALAGEMGAVGNRSVMAVLDAGCARTTRPSALVRVRTSQ